MGHARNRGSRGWVTARGHPASVKNPRKSPKLMPSWRSRASTGDTESLFSRASAGEIAGASAGANCVCVIGFVAARFLVENVLQDFFAKAPLSAIFMTYEKRTQNHENNGESGKSATRAR